MLSKGVVAIFLLLSSVSVCSAGVLTAFNITINTSSQSGNSGAIYFQFAGGLNADPASVSIDDFALGAPGALSAIPSPFSDGGVAGGLDALPLTIDNSGGLNDYEHYLVFGSTLTFQAVFDLPSVLTGNSGSELLWQLTSSDGITPVLTNDNSGNIGTISYDQTGKFTADLLGNDSVESIITATPEPATFFLVSLGLLLPLLRTRERANVSAD